MPFPPDNLGRSAVTKATAGSGARLSQTRSPQRHIEVQLIYTVTVSMPR